MAPVEVQVEVDERSVNELESTLREVERIANRAATETQSIALAAGRAEVNFEDVARALNISEDEARRLSTEVLQAQAAANRLEDSVRDIARQLGLSEDEARRFANSMQRAAREADDVNVRASALSSTFVGLRTVVGGITGALAVIGGGQILGALARSAGAALTQFQALNESINAVQVTFGSASQTVLDFGERSAQAAGLSAAAFQQAVVPIGSVLVNFGFQAREAADASVVLVQRAADLASVFNTEVAEALLAINSALVGQVEPLRRFGAEISVARVDAFALANGLARTTAEIDNSVRTQARLGLILQDTARVQGDFVNTSDQLANAQRIAAAEVANFGAEVGEVLAPALATLVGLLPDVLDGVRQLVPAFANAADSAAAFFEAIGEGGGFRTEFAAIRAGFNIVTAGAGLAKEAGAVFAAGLTSDLAGVTAAAQRGGALIERALTRGIGVALANSLDLGVDSLDAFRTAIQQTAASSSNLALFTGNFRDFAIAANLSKEELFDVTRELITNADALGLTAAEVDFLESRFVLLRDALFVVGNEANQAARAMGEIDQPLTTAGTRFTTFAGEVEDSQTRSSAALTQLAADTEAQLQRASAAFDLFAESPERIEGSFRRAVNTLRDQVEDAFDFDINIAILRALNLDALADEFQEQGVAAANQLAQAVENIPLAIEANQLLQGFASDVAEGFIDELVKRLVDFGLTPSEAQKIAQTLTSPQVIAAAQEAAKSFAGTQTDTYRDALISGMDQLVPELAAQQETNANIIWDDHGISFDAGSRDAGEYAEGIADADLAAQVDRILTNLGIEVDLFFVGQEAGESLIDGMVDSISSSRAVNDLHVAIEDATNDAIEARSPSRLMLRIGEAAGDAFWSGFNQADLTLRTPVTQMTGRIVDSSTVSGAASGGVNVELNINNPTINDAVSDAARLAQIASSIASTYRQVT